MTGPGGSPAAPRPFDCLWCGRPWQPRAADDLEAAARLCPDCLGRAGQNPFLRFRLREALAARAAGASPGRPEVAAPDPADLEAWYQRQGRHAGGPVQDAVWRMELDAATTWLDGLPVRGEIVELGAATGWWSALLATKGDLHAYDASGALLDRARRRLLAHGLRAHLHVRDPWAAPDRPVDAVVVPFLLGGAADARLASRLATVRSWLRPGGILAAISILDESAVEGVAAVDRLAAAPEELAAALRSAGFSHVECRPTGRCFLLARATAA